MIAMKSSINHKWPWAEADQQDAEAIFRETFPTLHCHLKQYEEWYDTDTKKLLGLKHREDRGRFWWELRSCDYYHIFERTKIAYQAIQFSARYSLEKTGLYGNNKTYFLPTDSSAILASLNSPVIWWTSWRKFLHLKDEALSNDAVKLVDFSLPLNSASFLSATEEPVAQVVERQANIHDADVAIADWLFHEFGLAKPGQSLSQAHQLDAGDFVSAVRKALPKRRMLSPAEIARLKKGYADTLEPARLAANQALALERKLSDLVNAAYGLTSEEVALMWATAPPRMPFQPVD